MFVFSKGDICTLLCQEKCFKESGFKDIHLAQDRLNQGRYFDRPLYILQQEKGLSATNLVDVNLLIFGGFRGDCNTMDLDESEVFQLTLKQDKETNLF